MNFQEYQELSRKTAVYPDAGDTLLYPVLGLVSESGEVAAKLKKHMRDDGVETPSQLSEGQKQELAKELGDVLWYVSQLATELGFELDAIAQMNIEKINSRMDRGALSGSGDNR